jgi:hypothetical protein
MGDHYFLTSCVGWSGRGRNPNPGADIQRMVDGARDISRTTFLKHVNRENLREIEAMLCYSEHPSQGLTMAGDWHVSYHRGKFCGMPVYYFVWSAIEHIFMRIPDIRRVLG